MGLDAFVPCNCFPESLRRPPPCPLEWLEWDEGHLGLKPEHDQGALWHRVHEWSQSACPHRGFTLIWERVDNWTGVALFLEAMEEHDFPVLKSLDGQLEWPQAAQGLREIERFRQLPRLNETTELLLGDEVVNCYAAYRQGVFLLDPRSGLNAGIDPNGFFLQCRQTHQELFRAIKFEHQGERFRNLDTQTTFETTLQFETGVMEVRTRISKPADFELIVASLEALYRASVEMQRPVYWT
ncbi:MAG: hypothetical protein KF760_23300 [Candidatus Eremiobacteraeota bacterium]|nr:hypothetical protein [Candidatus Eremiobacteraeota bacterium]MCW5866151.1 hypothetical protein [Candidatus Eremiobacteraeota bacterium]